MAIEKKTLNVPQWLNSVLLTILLVFVSYQIKSTGDVKRYQQKMTVDMAIVINDMSNHLETSELWTTKISQNSNKLAVVMTRNEIMREIDSLQEQIDKLKERI